MDITVTSENVYVDESVPEFRWKKYQRGFLGILNNAYNQSCNTGNAKLGTMSEIEQSFVEENGTGSWQDFVRFYVREHNGHERVQTAVDAMVDNIHRRVESVGGIVDDETARYWSRKYIWSMVSNTYRGFCSERTALRVISNELDVPYEVSDSVDEPDGIDGHIGGQSVQVKPLSHLGLDLNDHDAIHTVIYKYDEDVFTFEVPDELCPRDAIRRHQ